MGSRPAFRVSGRVVTLTSLSLTFAIMTWLVTWTSGVNLIHAIASGLGAGLATLVIGRYLLI